METIKNLEEIKFSLNKVSNLQCDMLSYSSDYWESEKMQIVRIDLKGINNVLYKNGSECELNKFLSGLLNDIGKETGFSDLKDLFFNSLKTSPIKYNFKNEFKDEKYSFTYVVRSDGSDEEKIYAKVVFFFISPLED